MKKEIDKYYEMIKLFMDCDDVLVQRFFDRDSYEYLDLKIKVLKLLNDGKKPTEINEYYDILELYPKGDIVWD